MKGISLITKENYSAALKSNNDTLILMPPLDHPFILSPMQKAEEIHSEYSKSENTNGIIILHYLKTAPKKINIRVCHDHYIQRRKNKFKIAALNHQKIKHWVYHGEMIYHMKFIPMTFQDNTPWPREREIAFISYFFNLARKPQLTTDRPACNAKIAQALKGNLTKDYPKKHVRVAMWLVNLGLWKA